MRIERIEPVQDRARLAPFLAEHLEGHRAPGYFDWSYRDNPAGPGCAWLALDDAGEIVGAAAAFPRSVRVDGAPVTAWCLGDFAIRQDQRSLGPAVRLQRACTEPVAKGEVPFAYDHPSCNMLAVYRWMGVEKTGDVSRWALPLRVDAQVERVLGDNPIARGVGGVGAAVLGLRRPSAARGAEVEVSVLDGAFDERFDALEEKLARHRPVLVARGAAYLTWRYREHPFRDHDVVVAERDGTVAGFAVCRREETLFSLVDLLAEDAGVERALLAEVARRAGSARVQTLSAPALGGSPLAGTLAEGGFRAREAAPFVVTAGPDAAVRDTVTDAASWYHSDGDRDG